MDSHLHTLRIYYLSPTNRGLRSYDKILLLEYRTNLMWYGIFTCCFSFMELHAWQYQIVLNWRPVKMPISTIFVKKNKCKTSILCQLSALLILANYIISNVYMSIGIQGFIRFYYISMCSVKVSITELVQ